MNRLSIRRVVFSLLVGCGSSQQNLPRIAVVGVGVECSTFSPAKTTLDMFRPKYGEEILESYPFFKEDTTLRQRAEAFTMTAWTTPGGIVTRETYDSLLNRSLRYLADMPYDALPRYSRSYEC